MSYPKITACMIVRNERRVIAEALENIAPYVDEILVWDQQSEDETAAIAERVVRGLAHRYPIAGGVEVVPYRGVCEEYRDEIMRHVTTPWVYVHDADERIGTPHKTPQILRQLVRSAQDDRVAAYSFQRINYVVDRDWVVFDTLGADDQVRLLRPDKVVWSTTVHARPYITDHALACARLHPSVQIHHLWSLSAQADKMRRYEASVNDPTERNRLRAFNAGIYRRFEDDIARAQAQGGFQIEPKERWAA